MPDVTRGEDGLHAASVSPTPSPAQPRRAPRVRRSERWNVGFTLDLSSQGACLRAKEAAPIGSLLRVIVRGVDGRPTLDSIARVVWSARGRFGEVRMGLSMLDARSRRPLRVVARKTAVTA